ncbi:MAG: ergothioneine biosynthesis protein EgtC [Leptolyngbyaceae cyanobacterium]
MCRLLGYIGPPINLDTLVLKPPHSLVVQAYAPQELNEALLNADGFGLGWYHPTQEKPPFTYRNILPIWNDINLEPLCRYVATGCALTYIRSATPGQAIDLANCQPFQAGQLLFTHNGYIKRFRDTLYQPMRQAMSDRVYAGINGSTDSEHIFGWLLTALAQQPHLSLVEALRRTLTKLLALAESADTAMAANILMSDGHQLVGARLASQKPAPSLYWLKAAQQFPDAVIVASEPLFNDLWEPVAESSLFTINANCDVQFYPLGD